MFLPSCALFPTWLYYPNCLLQLSCPGCLVPPFLSRLYCPGCPVPAVLYRLFCPGCLFPAVLSRLSFPGCPVPAILAVLLQHVQAHLSQLACLCCHVSASYPLCPVQVDVSRLACPGFMVTLSLLMSCPRCPVSTVLTVMAVLSWLSCPCFPIPAVFVVMLSSSCPI